MALLAEDVPERDRAAGEGRRRQTHCLEALGELWRVLAGLADAGEVAFDVGREDWHTAAAERFRDDLQGDGFAGAGGSRYQAMAVGKRGQQDEVGFGISLFRDQHRLGHFSPWATTLRI